MRKREPAVFFYPRKTSKDLIEATADLVDHLVRVVLELHIHRDQLLVHIDKVFLHLGRKLSGGTDNLSARHFFCSFWLHYTVNSA